MMIYMFSDDYQDQFGGPGDRKKERILKIILSSYLIQL